MKEERNMYEQEIRVLRTFFVDVGLNNHISEGFLADSHNSEWSK